MKAAVKNLGCKVNAYEAEFVRNLLIKNGYEIDEENPDIYVVNTCTVTNTSDNKSRKLIRKIRRENKSAVLVVMGCALENAKEDLSKIDADIIIGNKDKSKIIEYINEFLKERKKIIKFYENKEEFENMEIDKFETKTRAFVKIEDGCNNFCSYCIIPYVRGRVRSKSASSVIEEITSLVKNSHKEIVLTGIHTGQYNDNGITLSDLIEKILEINGLYRLRLSSIEITEIDDKLLKLFKENKIMANHFHIPLQSGSDKTLKDMNRKYSTNYFLEVVKKLREINEFVSISTDLIVGFPTETENDFINSYEFCKSINFSKIHVFPYSKRNGTKAASLKNIVDDKTKKMRTKKILELSGLLEKQYLEKNINRKENIIIEEKKDNFYIGHTSNYIKVYIEEDCILNNVYEITLTSIYKDGMKGKIS